MPNNQCVFPFNYHNKTHYGCITEDIYTNANENENYWCGTEYHVTKATNWGICNDVCPRENSKKHNLIDLFPMIFFKIKRKSSKYE